MMKLHARVDAGGHLVVHQVVSYVYQVLVSPQKVQKLGIWLLSP